MDSVVVEVVCAVDSVMTEDLKSSDEIEVFLGPASVVDAVVVVVLTLLTLGTKVVLLVVVGESKVEKKLPGFTILPGNEFSFEFLALSVDVVVVFDVVVVVAKEGILISGNLASGLKNGGVFLLLVVVSISSVVASVVVVVESLTLNSGRTWLTEDDTRITVNGIGSSPLSSAFSFCLDFKLVMLWEIIFLDFSMVRGSSGNFGLAGKKLLLVVEKGLRVVGLLVPNWSLCLLGGGGGGVVVVVVLAKNGRLVVVVVEVSNNSLSKASASISVVSN